MGVARMAMVTMAVIRVIPAIILVFIIFFHLRVFVCKRSMVLVWFRCSL